MAKVQRLICNNEPAQTEEKLQAPPSPQSGEISAFMKFFEAKRVELGYKTWTQVILGIVAQHSFCCLISSFQNHS